MNNSISLAQPDQHEPKIFNAADGKIYWNKALPVYVRISPTLDGEGTLLNSENQSDYVNPLYFDTEGINYLRTRWAVNPETRAAVAPKVEVFMEIYADGIAPTAKDAFLQAPRYSAGGTQFYGKGLEIDLSSQDAVSGVDQIYYALDGDEAYQSYRQKRAMDREGAFTLKYYAVDKVGNAGEVQTKSFTVDLTPPVSAHDVSGLAETNVLSPGSILSLSVEDRLSGVKQLLYRFDDGEFRVYDGKSLDLSGLDDGDHTLEYYAVDQVANQEATKRFDFYYDKTAPLTASDVLGDRYAIGGQTYFSGRTKMKLTAVDNKAGVKEILYAIDDGELQVYDQPFYLPNISGNHTIKYYAIDKLSNKPSGFGEFKHDISRYYLDLSGPDLTYDYQGSNFSTRDTVFINNQTQIQLSGVDKESGLQYLSYSLDGQTEEIRYGAPFTLDQPGFHRIEVFGYDNVNNRNVSEFFFVVDKAPPKIIPNFSVEPINQKEGLQVYPEYLVLFLAATDQAVGSDKIYYQINEAAEKLYTGPIKGFKKNTNYTIKLRSIDLLGNESTNQIGFYTSDQ